MKRIVVTTGDSDGIGAEVTCKALRDLGPNKDFQFVLYRSAKTPKKDLSRLDEKFRRVAIDGPEALKKIAVTKDLLEIISNEPPAKWVEDAAGLCLKKQAVAIVTAPLSKTGIHAAGLKDRGHTEIFSRLTKAKNVFMCFWGTEFNVLLLTDHLPLAKVPKALTKKRVKKGIEAALMLRAMVGSKKPLGVLGVNPHAGEEGLLGKDEKSFKSVLKRKDVEGPLVPDTAFLRKNWAKYSVFVCGYHDQGLIPFKLVHGFDKGVHLTLGLPFVRTSVDHGTAKELFGKDIADHGSMRDAIGLAMKLARG
jgi:4-hydroxythreonine-4-phosphate dehydrogenase